MLEDKNFEKVEQCWMVKDPTRLGVDKAPLDCLHCKRDIPWEYDCTFLDEKTQIFLSGYRFGIHEAILFIIAHDLDEQEKYDMLDGITKRMKCGIDRGLKYEHFSEGLREMLRLGRIEHLKTIMGSMSPNE